MSTPPFKVALLDDYQQVALRCADWTVLGGVEVTAFSDHVTDMHALVHRLLGFDAVVAMRERTPFPDELLSRLPHLRLLITTGGGNAKFDLAAAKRLGITVCSTRGLGWPTVELTWALILSMVRNVVLEDNNLRRGGWQRSVGIGLRGKTLGILGLGRIGTDVARIGVQGFGMNAIAWSPNLTAARAEAAGVEIVTKQELFARADVLSIHLVLSSRTEGLVGLPELQSMQETAYLVNTSRGPIVKEADLLQALEAGAIAGAALDVFDREPLPAGSVWSQFENVVLTPHLGYVTKENYELFFSDAIDDIRQFRLGTPIRLL